MPRVKNLKKNARHQFPDKKTCIDDGLIWTVHPLAQRLHPRARRTAGFRVDVFARQVRIESRAAGPERRDVIKAQTAPGQAAAMKIRDVTTVLGHANCITCLIWNRLDCSPIRLCFLTRRRSPIHRAGITMNSLFSSVLSFLLTSAGLVVVNFR